MAGGMKVGGQEGEELRQGEEEWGRGVGVKRINVRACRTEILLCKGEGLFALHIYYHLGRAPHLLGSNIYLSHFLTSSPPRCHPHPPFPTPTTPSIYLSTSSHLHSSHHSDLHCFASPHSFPHLPLHSSVRLAFNISTLHPSL